MAPTKKLAAYRLTPEDYDRIERLSEVLGVSRTKVIQGAIRTFARLHGVVNEETVQRIRDLIDRHGPDAEVALAVQAGTSAVPVSVGGRASHELVAAAWLRPVVEEETEDGRPPRPEPVPVTLWMRGTNPTIKFDVDPQRPGTTVRFPISDLWARWKIAPEPSAEATRSNAALRAAAGFPVDDDDSEEEAPLEN
jgi:hypothetical protein